MDLRAINDLRQNLWKLTPDRMAERLTSGDFKRYRHIQFISNIIAQKVAAGGARLIISIPPRHGKSWLISRWLPVWYLAHNPTYKVILTSYEAGFAATWGRAVRNAIQENESALGVQISQDSSAADRWDTTAGGGMTTAGAGGPITGKGGQCLIIDDPVKNYEDAMSETKRKNAIDWYHTTFYTRAEPGASIILLMTRWHQNDLAGYLLSKDNENHAQWQEIRIPAIAEDNDVLGRQVGEALCPERYDLAALEDIRKSIGSRAWSALYQQRPSAEEGNLIKREWLRFYENMPDMKEQMISVDASFTGKSTSDFVAIQVWGRDHANKYLLDQVHARMGIGETIKAMISISKKWPRAALKLIEGKANGPAIEDLLRHEISGIVLWEPTGDKVARVNAVAPQFESGNVFFPLRQPWTHDLVEELVSFPNAKHDDSVDAMSQALLRMQESEINEVGIMRIVRR